MEKTEKSIRRIGIYFLVLGVISALYGSHFCYLKNIRWMCNWTK